MGALAPLELSVEEFLARLKHDRAATVRALHIGPWRLTSSSVSARDFWTLFDEAIRDDGTVDLGAFAAREAGDADDADQTEPPRTVSAERWRAANAIVGLSLAAYVAGEEMRLTIENEVRGCVTIRAGVVPVTNHRRKIDVMPLLQNQIMSGPSRRTYHVHIPADPPQATVPAIVVFHGGGQDVATIAQRWGVDPRNPIPSANVADYLLVFPEAIPLLREEWVHFQNADSAFPTPRPEVRRGPPAGDHHPARIRHRVRDRSQRQRRSDPDLYAAGFSNGGGMVWQLANSDLVARFRGFAAVGKALDPEKAEELPQAPRRKPAGSPPRCRVIYVHGTGDKRFRPAVEPGRKCHSTPHIRPSPCTRCSTATASPPTAPAVTTTLDPGAAPTSPRSSSRLYQRERRHSRR